MSDFEQEAWNAAVAPTEEVAAVEPEEVAPAEPEETATAHTEVQEEVVEEATAEMDTEPDEDFQDLLDPIPTKESLLAKHSRIPQATKDELVGLADNWRATNEKLESIGGNEGVEMLTPVFNYLASPTWSPDAAQQTFAAMFKVNPEASIGMVAEAAAFMLSDEAKRHGIGAVGDKLLESEFGVNGQTIREYVLLEKAGYVDRENDLKLLNTDGNGSSLYQKQESELAVAKQEIQKLQEQIRNPQIPKEVIAATDAFDTTLNNKLEEAITPFLEKAGWEADSPLTQIVKKALVAEIKSDKLYKDAIAQAKETANWESHFGIKQAIQSLVTKGKAKFVESVKGINTQFKQRPTRNEEVKAKVEQTKPKSEPLKSSTSVVPNRSHWEDELYKETIGAYA